MYKLLKITKRQDTELNDCSVQFNDEDPIIITTPVSIGSVEKVVLAFITKHYSETQSEVDAYNDNIKVVEASLAYRELRKTKYDALNQLELISDDAINGTTTHKDAILAIKAEIPKPTGE